MRSGLTIYTVNFIYKTIYMWRKNVLQDRKVQYTTTARLSHRTSASQLIPPGQCLDDLASTRSTRAWATSFTRPMHQFTLPVSVQGWPSRLTALLVSKQAEVYSTSLCLEKCQFTTISESLLCFTQCGPIRKPCSSFFLSRVIFTLAASSGKRNVMVWRRSVCLFNIFLP